MYHSALIAVDWNDWCRMRRSEHSKMEKQQTLENDKREVSLRDGPAHKVSAGESDLTLYPATTAQ